MPPLRRHQLAYLSAQGWQAALEPARDAQALDCLRHWCAHGLPLVVTRQPLPLAPERPLLHLGLSAPPAWGRRLLSLRVPATAIAWFSEFPSLADAAPVLPRTARAALAPLQVALAERGLRAHAYGSVGWQQLSAQRYLHPHSDLDLWLPVAHALEADAAAALLLRHAPQRPRVDGELVFPDGGAVAWREWAAWRAGHSRALLVKRLHGAALEAELPAGWTAPPLAQAA
ncbi:malonate decarboxylase holo-[acyl-carrier-protein] synthase [Azohydromonas lata]|nr:malonate decarboxylase holo-[acyl-carrier-protein] synthase [Azohydromonas lata]